MVANSEVKYVDKYEPKANDRVELKNGKIVDVMGGSYFDSAVSLIIEEGKIKAMPGVKGQTGDIKADFTIDLQGKTVMPGLFNTHCHITTTSPSILPGIRDIKLFKTYGKKQIEKNMSECLIHGITNIRDAYAEDLRHIQELRERIDKNELKGPRVMQAVVVGPPGGYLTEKYGFVMKSMRSALGIPPLDHELDYSGVVEFPIDATTDQVRDTVNRAIDERGAEVIKVGEQLENMTNFKPDSTIMNQEQLSAIADQSRKRGLQSTIHHVSAATFRRAVKAGISSLAHFAVDEELTEEDAAAFISQGCVCDPTISVAYDLAYKIKGDPTYDDPSLALLSDFRNRVHPHLMDEYWIPEFKAGALAHHHKAENGKIKIFGLMPMTTMFKYYCAGATIGVRNFQRLYEKGAVLSTSNDGGVPPCTPAMMQHEIDLFDLFLNQDEGQKVFKGADAVKMASLNGAKSMGLDDKFGTIETGKVADLAIVGGDPFEDHHVVGSRVAALFMDGGLVINNCDLQLVAAD